jgi:RimJ/RimL family protein N-acetyltransferase
MRNVKIAIDRFNKVSLKDFLLLVLTSLFCCDTILIYKNKISLNVQMDLDENTNSIVKGKIEDLDAYRRGEEHDYWEFNCHKYDHIEDFFVSAADNTIQHISWLYDHNSPNRIINLAPSQVEIKYCLTLPAYRGQGIYPRVLKHITEYCREQYVTDIFMAVDRDNFASIRGIEKAGFTKVHKMKLVKIFGLQLTRKYDGSKNNGSK